MTVFRFGPVLAALLLLVSCDQAANRVSTLWTNVPEMASYVELFNASQREWQILVEYQEDPVPLLLTPGRKADLIIARNLTSKAIKNLMVPLDFVFDGGKPAKASFYKRSLDAGYEGEKLKLLPLSFDLPILIFSRAALPDLPGFSLDLDTLKGLGSEFTSTQEPKARKRMGFSPRWQFFGLTVLQLRGGGFQEGFQETLSWDSAKLAAGLDLLRTWPGPEWDEVTSFQQIYLQTDPTLPLVSGRILFYPSTLATFLSRPWNERRQLDFRFIEQGGRVATADDTVWAGIPSSSLTRGAGERFLSWFFQGETQKLLITQARAEDDRAFGLARGLSTLADSNTATLAAVYPEMAGRLPGIDQVAFWEALPTDWAALKTGVLRPWLDSPATEASLKEKVELFRAQAVRN